MGVTYCGVYDKTETFAPQSFKSFCCPASQLRAAGNRTGINLVRRSVFEKPMEIGGWSVLAAQL
jgi:hypothetical protein